MNQKFRRKGFVFGLFAGLLFVAYKAWRYSGPINRGDTMFCLAVVLFFGLVGGLIGLALGAAIGRARRKDEDGNVKR